MTFSLPEDVTNLADALMLFKKRNVNIKHIKSRPSKNFPSHYDFFATFDTAEAKPDSITTLLEDLKETAKNVELHRDDEIPWFPRKISDLDRFADRILNIGAELAPNHPGFTDPVYCERRRYFADIAIKYKHGEPLPYVEYTQEEIGTWSTAFTELTKLYPTHACKEVNAMLPLLIENCNYRVGTIPQLKDVSKFLKERTGFTLRPVSGLLSLRDFLAGLAFRVFHTTQYIRHSKTPMFTPEPDCIHELIGHVPLFADPSFAQLSQEIGLSSLGAPDEWILKLATLYWFTAEFGLCRQNGEIKAYGAGLLSSYGELQYCLTDKPDHNKFDPEKIANTTYPITEYQPQYFIADTFDDAKLKVREWAAKIPKPFSLRYNAYTQSVETLEDKEQIIKVIREVKNEMERGIEDALQKYH